MRVIQPEGTRGSLKWMQRLATFHPGACDAQLRALGALADGDSLEWLSPRRDDDRAEYRDAAFLQRIGHPELIEALRRLVDTLFSAVHPSAVDGQSATRYTFQ